MRGHARPSPSSSAVLIVGVVVVGVVGAVVVLPGVRAGGFVPEGEGDGQRLGVVEVGGVAVGGGLGMGVGVGVGGGVGVEFAFVLVYGGGDRRVCCAWGI